MTGRKLEVPLERLRWTCNAGDLGLEETPEVPPVEGIVGQDRGLQALEVGLEMGAAGYNIFVVGFSGTGRTTAVKRLLARLAPRRDTPRDRVYVHNFDDPGSPRLIKLPFGRGAEFAREMEEFTAMLGRRLPRLFDDQDFAKRRNELVTRFGERERDLMKGFSDKVQQDGFTVGQVQVGPVQRPSVFAVIDDQLVSEEKIGQLMEEGQLDEEQGGKLLEKYQVYRDELQEVLRRMRANTRKMVKEVERLYQESAAFVFEGHLSDLRVKFEDIQGIQDYLAQVESDLLERTVRLPGGADWEEDGKTWRGLVVDSLKRYTVNVVTDRSGAEGAPVVEEHFPTRTNLFGTVKPEGTGPGQPAADHRHVVPGSLLKADGGYLILSARDVLAQTGVWEALKQTLKTGRLEIQPPGESNPFSGISLKPEPLDIDVKVIMIGEPGIYDTLFAMDSEFRKIFKIKADFDDTMDRNPENLRHFAAVMARICHKEELLPLDGEALAATAEYAVGLAGRRDRISTRFNQVADLVREASFLARRRERERITAGEVHQAERQMEFRHNLQEERLDDLVEKDVIMVATEGKTVGQVNGLSVHTMGCRAFGKPTRITASTSVGSSGIINVEREARLSGGIYDKGVLIISGWMRRVFAQRRPLSLAASLCFEQSYSGVDGDSASVAEIAAIVSELSGVPIDQGIAVTGSVNQHGQVQPIGGVNEKVTGFFRVCCDRGLTGGQGCLIPARNVDHLHLPPAVMEAVSAGRYRLYAVKRVEEALEVLMGLPAGRRDEQGAFPGGTLFDLVEKRLTAYAEAGRAWSDDLNPRYLAEGGGRGAAAEAGGDEG